MPTPMIRDISEPEDEISLTGEAWLEELSERTEDNHMSLDFEIGQ